MTHSLGYLLNTLIVWLNRVCKSEAKKQEQIIYDNELEEFQNNFISSYVDHKSIAYQKAKLTLNFRDYDDYYEMRPIIWTKPLRWINSITSLAIMSV